MAKQEKITTIKLKQETKQRLDGLKEHPRETYDDVITKTLNIINITIRNPIAGSKIFRKIKHKTSRKDVVYSSIPKHISEESEEGQEQEVSEE